MFLNRVKIFRKVTIVGVLLMLATATFNASAQGKVDGDPAKGKELFENNCASCHAVHKVMVGPALKGITERRKIDWIIQWVKNPAKVIASGDPYATKLAADFKSAGIMTGFAALADQDIKNIMAYIPTVPEEKAAAGGPVAAGGAVKQDNTFINWVLAGFVVVLLAMLLALTLVISVLKKYMNQNINNIAQEDRYLVEEPSTLKSLTKTTGFKMTIIFLVLALIGKTSIDYLTSIGMQQGYAPEQPVPFSHKLHAGKYKIDCNYCHTGVRIGKHANIPSANICMNCHSQIKKESAKLKPIRDAYETGKPVEWVRVHNLPDLAYFNHSQHVKVGGLECQTCHGPIQEMEVVQQYSPLTMGWCINCHRETVVKAEGNKYYDNLLKLHNKDPKADPMKVKDIGGLECSKCHY
ncbi:MAG: cytochrome c3 family protein [Cytophagales bacterium]